MTPPTDHALLHPGCDPPRADDISTDGKVAFLSRAASYGPAVCEVIRIETHMSWIFLAGDVVYKLKKPLRLPYLDFSTLARREAACRAELTLNRRLAPDVYEAVTPLRRSRHGLAIGGTGETVDWLVVMRRLDRRRALEHALASGGLPSSVAASPAVASWQLDRLVSALSVFYRHAGAVLVSPDTHLRNWSRSIACNRRVLLDPQFDRFIPSGLVRQIDRAQWRFLAKRSGLIAARVRRRRIVDGHGDLRPEHIWPGDPVRIIDCLEFNSGLRAVDPWDEIAFLCVECERYGGNQVSEYIRRRARVAMADGVCEPLFTFYRCHRATLRARLTIAHLLEPDPRTPEKWPPLARTYLGLAARDARRLEKMLAP